MSARSRTTGDVIAKARQDIAAAVLADPGEHYPYKIDAVARLLERNPAMGPAGKDDDSVRAEDLMTRRIADASQAYIDAQAAFRADPTPAAHEMYEAAKDDLVAARQAHRRSRVDEDGRPVVTIIGMTPGPAPENQRGPRARRIGED